MFAWVKNWKENRKMRFIGKIPYLLEFPDGRERDGFIFLYENNNGKRVADSDISSKYFVGGSPEMKLWIATGVMVGDMKDNFIKAGSEDV